MDKNIRNLERTLFLGFAMIAIGLVYWQVFRAETLLARTDNPRQVIAAQKIKRGSIVTTDGTILAETILNENGFAQRVYHNADLSPVLGYYSFRYGTSGLEGQFDEYLRGEQNQTWLDELLHRPLQGSTLTVTLDLPSQMMAMKLFKDYHCSGSHHCARCANGRGFGFG